MATISDEMKAYLESIGFSTFLLLSAGSYGSVYKVFLKTLTRPIAQAIKIVEDKQEKMLHEIKMMETLSHKNIIEFYGWEKVDLQCALKMEFATHGTVRDFISTTPNEADTQRAELWIGQLINGLGYIHSFNIAHRDVKCLNSLLLKGGNLLKIGDFGLAREFDQKEDGSFECHEYLTTTLYAPPEVLYEKPHNPFFHDSWSTGILLYYMLEHVLPFQTAFGTLAMAKRQLSGTFRPPLNGNEKTNALLKGFLDPSIKTRLTIQQAKEEFFSGAELDEVKKRMLPMPNMLSKRGKVDAQPNTIKTPNLELTNYEIRREENEPNHSVEEVKGGESAKTQVDKYVHFSAEKKDSSLEKEQAKET